MQGRYHSGTCPTRSTVLERWIAEAAAAGVEEPTAAALATADADGRPVAALRAAARHRRAGRALLHQLREPQGARAGRQPARRARALLARRCSARCASRAPVERLRAEESDAYFALAAAREPDRRLGLAPVARARLARGARRPRRRGRGALRGRRRAAPGVLGRLPAAARARRALDRARRTACTTASSGGAAAAAGRCAGSALDGAGRQPAHEVALGERVEDERGHHRERREGEDPARCRPCTAWSSWSRRAAASSVSASVSTTSGSRNAFQLPTIASTRHGGQHGPRQRQQDPPEEAERAAAVDRRGVLELVREAARRTGAG